MSRQIGSLHRSNSHSDNLQNPIHIIALFAFPPPDSPRTNTSSGMNSDTNSDITVFQTISQFNNSDVETPDEFADSESSPSTHTQTTSSTFSKPPHKTEIKTPNENNFERVSRTNSKTSLFKNYILNGTQTSLSSKKTRSARDAENGDTTEFPAE